MTSTPSSLMAAAPLFCPPSPKARDSNARSNVLLARLSPNSRRSRSLGQRSRWMSSGAKGKQQANTRLFCSWKQHGYRIDGKGALGIPAEQLGSLACFRSQQWCRGHIRRQEMGMFRDKSTFSIHKYPIWRNAGKSVQIPHATLGPDEPHVASTAWSETAHEKQGLGFWTEAEKAALEGFLNSQLPPHPKLQRGQLKNGLRYIILPNKIPVNRFEAHMEVHVGSIDEEDDEQGIAHMIEHVAFLGSKKREKLLGTGARSNAYTDFHHTVFHIHSPTITKDSDEDLLPSVLDALNEIAFHPKFLESRVEKERRAILSELQMMNTIEYRVDCQLLQHLHSENKLSKRFPIGLEEQIKKWDSDKIRKFHERWYFPANATLYLVGDIRNIPKAVQQIEAVFERTLEDDGAPTVQSPSAFGAMASFLVPKLPGGLAGSRSVDRSSISLDQQKLTKKEKHAVRPPIEHNWSLPGFGDSAKLPEIFQHEFIQHFSINMFCKIPVEQVQTYGDLRNVLMKRIFLSALQFRINTRYKSSNPPFTSIEMDHSDSGREGCTVTTLTVTAEPKNWRDAIKVAVHEVRRLKEFGVTNGELNRYMDALIKDSEQLATMIDSVPSVDNLDFIMESDALGHTVMDQMQAHESLVAVAETVTLEEVNSVGAEVLEFISDYGKPTAPLPAAIVACVPKKVHVDGVGESEFNIYPHEIVDAMKEGLEEPIHAEPELEVPKELITSTELEMLRLQRRPYIVPIQGGSTMKLFDKETGITQIRLSNGIPVNYKISNNEARCGVMRLIVGGGRSTETSESKGAVVVGVRTLSEGGCVGSFSREQVELFCVNHLVNCSLESNEECICMEFRFTLRDDGMRAAFQLLHMVLEHSVWLEDAFERAKQLYMSYYRSIPKSLERSTAHKIMWAMLNGDERFVEPTPQSLQNLTLHSVKAAVMNQFVSDNMEVSIVGDFLEDDLESCILDYLGTVSARTAKTVQSLDPIMFRPSPSDLQSQQVYLKDTDERACAYIAGPAPNRWGFSVEGKDLFDLIKSLTVNDEQFNSERLLQLERKDVQDNVKSNIRQHPLFFGVTLGLLAEIINSRLFTTVRDSLGLTYDVSFELSLFDRLKLGWYVISVTSTPSKVYKAVDACKNVLRGLHNNKIAQRELDRAKRTLMMKHEAESKTNTYWLGLLAHLQSSSTSRKDISCIKDLNALYEAATIEDIYVAYEHLKVDDASLFSCIGVAGVQSGEDAPGAADKVPDIDHQGFAPIGRGLSTMTRPTT